MRMNNKKLKIQTILLYSALLFYVILSLSLLIFRYGSPLELFNVNRTMFRNVNVIPFRTIYSYMLQVANVSSSIAFNNIVGNIVLFIPLGIYLQLLKQNKRISISVLFILFVSLSIEIIQFVFGIGATDIDDIILNCLGGIIGIACYRLLILFTKDPDKTRSIVSILGAIVGIPLFCIVTLLLIVNS